MPNLLRAEKEMKPYNPQGRCPKCGYDDIATIYHKNAQYLSPCWCKVSVAHLCRCCRRCQYEWCEAVLEEIADV